MKKVWSYRLIALAVLVCALLSESVVVAFATTAGEQLHQAERDKSNAERGLGRTQDKLADLHNERASVQTYLDQLNEKLNDANNRLFEIEQIREEKEQAIEEAQKTIADAKEQQVVRYEEMKGRIKFMYEQGSKSYLDIFLSATSFSDFLNKADYIESINKYDRQMLKEYKETEEKISKKEKELKEDQDSLVILQEEALESCNAVFTDVKETSSQVQGFMDEIAKREEQALAYEKEIAEAESDIAVLKEEYKKELAMSLEAASLVNRDLSDVAFASGDIDLLAAIIECEAGGESYTGKVAVGAVVLNRVRNPRFPGTVLEVIMQNRQFSPVGSGRFSIVLARRANESCYQAATDAMAGASPVGNCLFFRTPIPGLTGQQIGGHIFY